MDHQKKSVEDLLIELHQLEKGSGQKIRKLQVDQYGNLLLNENNPSDVEWYENDAVYDVVQS